MKLVLDTCAILWAVADPLRLTKHARAFLELETSEILISPISCAEIARGVDRQRIKLDRHWKSWFRYYIRENQWKIIPIDLRIMEEAYSLPELFHDDPADRIIVATARLISATIVTGDRKILDYPHVDSVC